MATPVTIFPERVRHLDSVHVVRSDAAEHSPTQDRVPHRPLAVRFGERLRALRHARGMTQMQVAVHFGIDRTFLSDVERGRKSVSLQFLEIFALGYELSISELLDEL